MLGAITWARQRFRPDARLGCPVKPDSLNVLSHDVAGGARLQAKRVQGSLGVKDDEVGFRTLDQPVIREPEDPGGRLADHPQEGGYFLMRRQLRRMSLQQGNLDIGAEGSASSKQNSMCRRAPSRSTSQ